MSEIYWITRLDTINTYTTITCILGLFATVLSIIVYVDSYFEEDKKTVKIACKSMKIIFPITIIGILGNIFIPTTKEALLIYGVGGTIDYIKSNDKIKHLPDKCVDASDKFISEYTKEK